MPGVPSDKIGLRLLLVSGASHVFTFQPTETASDVVRHVFSNWPVEWDECPTDRAKFLRLLYQGKFLSDETSLLDLHLSLGKVTVMHLILRESRIDQLQEEQGRGARRKTNPQSDGCCVIL